MQKWKKMVGMMLTGVLTMSCINAGNIIQNANVQAASTKEIDAKKKNTVKISNRYKGFVTLYGEKKKLTISGGKKIKGLTIQSEKIKEVNIKNKMLKLKEFTVYGAEIKNIDFRKMPKLEEISTGSVGTISNAKKGLLKLDGLKKLKEITIYGTTYNSLSVANCKKLKSVFFYGSGKVDIKNCPKLKSVDCDACDSLRITGCRSVKSINCRNSKAYIKKCPNVTSIDVGMNGSISLKDIYECKKLEKLVARKSIISKLNQSKLPKLKTVEVAEEASSEE